MSRQYKRTLEELLVAIEGSHGIKTTIAARLGMHRYTVDKYLQRYSSALAAYEDECDRVGDVAESIIFQSLLNGDLETAKWYAVKKLKHRGYTERHEVGGKDNEDISIQVSHDVDDRIMDLLARLSTR